MDSRRSKLDMQDKPPREDGENSDYWGRYARTYDGDTDYVVGRLLRRSLSHRLSQEEDLGDVLECGCGTGYYTRAIAGRAKRILAADISEEMLGAAKARCLGITHVSFLQVNCANRNFPATSFDTVLMANLLNTVARPERALAEAYRVLKYGGLFIAIAYTDYDADALGKIAIGKRYFEKFGLPPVGGLINYSPEKLTAVITGSKFTVSSLDIFGDTPKALYVRASKNVVIADC